jgi:thiol-disulfide isomerase/thioredoxin
MKIKEKLKDALLWAMITTSFLLLVYHTVRPNKANHSAAARKVEIENGTNLSQLVLKHTSGKDFVIPQTGKYLVAFLTTGCEPCLQQMPRLNELAKADSYDGVIGIFAESVGEVKEFELSHKLEFICLADDKGSAKSLLNLKSYPQTTEIHDGAVTRSWIGLQKSFD